MIYVVVLLAFFFTACSPEPFRVSVFEFEVTHPPTPAQKQKEALKNKENVPTKTTITHTEK